MSSRPLLRWAAPPIAVALCLIWGWTGVKSWQGAAAMAQVTMRAQHDPLTALVWNSLALDLFPFPSEWRRQISALMTESITRYQAQLVFDGTVPKRVWDWGRSVGPADTTVLEARAQYLLNYGPYEELPPIVATLKQVAPMLHVTWLAAGFTAALQGDKAAMKEAALTGLGLPKLETEHRAMYRALLEGSQS